MTTKIAKCKSRLEFKGNGLACERVLRHKGKHRSHYRYTVEVFRDGQTATTPIPFADKIHWNDSGEWEFAEEHQ
jgi:hypothetical protein